MNRLLELGVLPIVNENDTVATAEIRFGDNDRLAALVAELLQADILVLLSDVDALYTAPPADPGATRVVTVAADDELENVRIGGSSSTVGTGGAETKVSAAKLANASGIPVLLTSTANVSVALEGQDVGTWFEAVKAGE
jgi:glutamate 5-kinase